MQDILKSSASLFSSHSIVFPSMAQPLTARIFTLNYSSQSVLKNITTTSAVPLLRVGRFAVFLKSQKTLVSQEMQLRMLRPILLALLTCHNFTTYRKFVHVPRILALLVSVRLIFNRIKYWRKSTLEIYHTLLCLLQKTESPLDFLYLFPNSLSIDTSLKLKDFIFLVIMRNGVLLSNLIHLSYFRR